MVTLNNKDADFIANILRDEIKRLDKGYEEAAEKGQRRYENVMELLSSSGEEFFGIPTDKMKDDMHRVRNESKNKLDAHYQELKDGYTKCIELLMCGSNE